jgi:hypothetical protein
MFCCSSCYFCFLFVLSFMLFCFFGFFCSFHVRLLIFYMSLCHHCTHSLRIISKTSAKRPSRNVSTATKSSTRLSKRCYEQFSVITSKSKEPHGAKSGRSVLWNPKSTECSRPSWLLWIGALSKCTITLFSWSFVLSGERDCAKGQRIHFMKYVPLILWRSGIIVILYASVHWERFWT